MTDQSQPTVDSAGIQRQPDGQITDGQTTRTDQATDASNQNTNQQTNPNSSLLNQQEPPKPAIKPEDKPEDKKSEAKGPPEAYADYTVPEGYTLDPEIKTKADAVFKDLGLDQAGAQKLVDFYIAQTNEAFEAPFKAYQDTVSDWRKAAEAHPDLRGKLGPGGEINVSIAKALDSIGDPALSKEFREVMDLTGVGNHPAFIRTIARWAAALGEGTHVAGNGPSPTGQSKPGTAPPSAAAAIWPSLPSASR